jgi:ribonuclease P protein component
VLARAFRIRKGSDFDRVREKGICWSDRLLVVCAVRSGLEVCRFGVITSKRLGNAVTRNRVRRRIAEALRLQHDRVAVGWDVVVIARKLSARADYFAIEGSITDLLAKGGLHAPGMFESDVPKEAA